VTYNFHHIDEDFVSKLRIKKTDFILKEKEDFSEFLKKIEKFHASERRQVYSIKIKTTLFSEFLHRWKDCFSKFGEKRGSEDIIIAGNVKELNEVLKKLLDLYINEESFHFQIVFYYFWEDLFNDNEKLLKWNHKLSSKESQFKSIRSFAKKQFNI